MIFKYVKKIRGQKLGCGGVGPIGAAVTRPGDIFNQCGCVRGSKRTHLCLQSVLEIKVKKKTCIYLVALVFAKPPETHFRKHARYQKNQEGRRVRMLPTHITSDHTPQPKNNSDSKQGEKAESKGKGMLPPKCETSLMTEPSGPGGVRKPEAGGPSQAPCVCLESCLSWKVHVFLLLLLHLSAGSGIFEEAFRRPLGKVARQRSFSCPCSVLRDCNPMGATTPNHAGPRCTLSSGSDVGKQGHLTELVLSARTEHLLLLTKGCILRHDRVKGQNARVKK